jgi:uncharacterized CHY-type Zn-finger protein
MFYECKECSNTSKFSIKAKKIDDGKYQGDIICGRCENLVVKDEVFTINDDTWGTIEC